MAYAHLLSQPDGSIALQSSYHAGLVGEFKSAVPPTMRRWDKDTKRWLFDASYARHVARLCFTHLGISPAVPTATVTVRPEQRLVLLKYLGRTKERPDGERVASGWVDGTWSYLFPERVLRRWFEPGFGPDDAPETPTTPGPPPTLYTLLAVPATADEDELRIAFKRMVRQWHPDVNKEPDAHERFIAIKEAHEVLSNPRKRKKYDLGLTLEQTQAEVTGWAQGASSDADGAPYGYRAPLLCGVVLVTGQPRMGQFVVSVIEGWEDVVRGDGKTLVVSWPPGADTFTEVWL